MANLNISIDLLKLDGSRRVMTTLGDGTTVHGVLIPVDLNQLQIRTLKDGREAAFIELAAWETQNNQYGNSHFVKRRASKKERETKTQDELRAMPILGNVREFGREATTAEQVTLSAPPPVAPSGDDSAPLPF